MKVIVTSFPSAKDIVTSIENDLTATVGLQITQRQCKLIGFKPDVGNSLGPVNISVEVAFSRLEIGPTWLLAEDAMITSGINALLDRSGSISFRSERGTRTVKTARI